MEDINIIDVKTKHQTRDNVFYELTIPNAIGGSVTRSVYASSYLEGSTVTLTAVPRTGYKFTGWVDEIDGSTNPLLVIMNSNITKQAKFNIIQNELIVNIENGGTFTKVPSGDIVDGKTLFKYGSNVTLTAIPSSGYLFVGWNGTVNSKNLKFIVTMNKPITLNAEFKLIEYTLIVNISGLGSINKLPDKEKYTPDELFALTAIPDNGNQFINWINQTKQVISTNSIISNMELKSDLTITAVFDTIKYKLIVIPSPNLGGFIRRSSNGTIIKGKNYYLPNSVVTLSAISNLRYKFERWDGFFNISSDAIKNPLVITIERDTTLQAIFSTIQYELKFNIVGNGHITRNPSGNIIDEKILYVTNTRVLLTGVPDIGWEFSKSSYNDNLISNKSPFSIIMKSHITIDVEFRLMKCELILNIIGEGNIDVDPVVLPQPNGKMLYNHGTIITLTSKPKIGHQFINWTNTYATEISPLDELSPITTTTITSHRSITVTFEIIKFKIDVTYDKYGGNITYVPRGTVINGMSHYNPNTPVILTAVPNSKYQFDGWSGFGVLNSRNNPLNIDVNRDIIITANFSVKRFLLTVTWTDDGTVQISPAAELVEGKLSFPIGEYVTLKPVPVDSIHKFYGWSGDIKTNDDPLIFSIVKDMIIHAYFDLVQFELKLTYDSDCIVDRSPEGRFVNGKLMYVPGTVVSLTAICGVGHYFVHWTGAAGNIFTVNPILPNFTLTSERAFIAVFELIPYDLTVVCEPPLSCNIVQNPLPILKNGEPKYLFGTPVNITITINFGFLFDKWTGTNINDVTNLSIDTIITNNTLQVANCTVAYQLLITQDTGGTVVKDKVGDMVTGKEMFRIGTPIKLIATPNDGYRFIGWEGTNVGDPTIYNIDIIIDKTTIQNANFIVSYQLILNVTEGGTIEKSSEGILDHERIMYDENKVVIFTPIPDIGYRFFSFEGNGIDSYFGFTPKAYTIDHHITMQATFIKIFELIASVDGGNGTITISPAGNMIDGKRIYDDGVQVTLTAFPTDLYELEMWSGTSMCLTRVIQITMDDNKTYTAKFVQTYWDLIVNITGSGSCTYSPVYTTINGRKMYKIDTEVTLTPTNSDNWVFTGWDDDTFDPLTIVMDKQQIVNIKFIQVVPVYFYDANSGVKLNPTTHHGNLDVDCADKLTINNQLYVPIHVYINSITPVPNTGYVVTYLRVWSPHWWDYYLSISNQESITSIYTYVYYVQCWVSFAKKYQLTFDSMSNGYISSFSPAGLTVNNKRYYDPNQIVNLVASPNSGYRCDGWVIDETSSSGSILSTYSITMTKDTIIKAKFISGYRLQIVNGGGDSSFTYTLSPNPVKVDSDKMYFDLNTDVTFIVTLNTSYAIDYLYVNSGIYIYSNSGTFKMTSDLVLYVYSSQAYRVTFAIQGIGTITRNPIGTEISSTIIQYPVGKYFTTTATPSVGYMFNKWTHPQYGVRTNNPNGYYNHWDNMTITAYFDKVYELKLVLNGGNNVSLTASPNANYTVDGKTYYISGTSVTLTLSNISVSTNRIVSWENEISNKTNTRSITINADITETVTVVQQVELHFHGIQNGSISFSPAPNSPSSFPLIGETSLYFDCQVPITVTINPNSGYAFSRAVTNYGHTWSTSPFQLTLTVRWCFTITIVKI